ncbi:MAG: hypothetical protein GWO19_01275, partial [Nitrospinaceae bacterium]|nr:hypothetical protein [Nitrospinaceae bacterium]NIS83824.1 hypothetical protein [Nitrospinaceae bacterium]NIU95020.1 hypothetical protein [Nitrospinaceae bacterium]
LLRHKPRYVLKTFPDLDLDTLEEITGLRYRRVKVLLARFALYRLSGWTSVAVNPLTRPWREKMQVMDRLTRHPWHAPNVMKDDLEAGRLRTAFKECRKLLRLNPDDFRGWI